METPFLEISGAGINLAHVESVHNLSGKLGTPVSVHFVSGNNKTLEGEDADGLRRVLADVTVKPPAPPAVKAGAAPAGQVSAADVAAAQPKKVA